MDWIMIARITVMMFVTLSVGLIAVLFTRRAWRVASLTSLLSAVAIIAAFAQAIPLPYVQSLAQTDAIAVIPRGSPSAQSYYATPGQVGGVENYSYQVPLTAFTITPPNGTSLLYLNPAGTLATGTLTMQAQPSDGQKFTLESSQTQTAITIQANTGQTLASGTYGLTTPTALVANTQYTWIYFAAQSTWVRRS